MRFGNIDVDISTTTLMGVLNMTPDSFSDGGRFLAVDLAIKRGLALFEQGAIFIDIGGESTRPGADCVSVDEEIARVEPVVKALSEELAGKAVISIDTRNRKTAERAYLAGASLLNDISALKHDKTMVDFAVQSDLVVSLMHMKDCPSEMSWSSCRSAKEKYVYDDVVEAVYSGLAERRDFAISSGIHANRILLDVGLGFGKTVKQNFQLIRQIDRFSDLQCPMIIGASRKSFLGAIHNKPASERLIGSLGVAAWCAQRGVSILRVHDVEETKEILEIFETIQKS